MLYPKNAQPFSDALFEHPTSEYRGAPFWAWNCELDEAELTRQIDVLRGMGYGGFHMHVRTGMATKYLSDEYMALVKACVEKARKDGMLAWLYDEDRWPSGAAGGYVTRDPENRMHYLLLTRTPYGAGEGADRVITSSAASARTGNGKLLAAYDVRLDGAGNLAGYRRIGESDASQGFKLYAYLETAETSPWFNNQAYADTLNPKVIRGFLKVTHDRYAEFFEEDFGGIVPAIFTDEPQFSHKTALGRARDIKDVTLPWTSDLPETYREAYGADILDTVPELLWEKPEGVSQARYRYHDHIAERFAQAFADQCGSWCRAHNLMLTGHMMEEPTLYSQTRALGEAMRSYRSFQLPGIDMLCNRREYTTAKQAQSAARQFGCPGVLSELYGVTNWDYDFRGHKLQGDWQAALGVTVRVPHLSWVSMNGEAKRDYPATFNYQAPWHDQYAYIEDHFARVNAAMTRGEAIARVGVIHPVESYWLHWGAVESTRAVREQMDQRFQNLTDWLLTGLIDFDFLSESLLPDQCDLGDISKHGFPAGKMRYDAMVVPGCETLRATTLQRLEAFRNAGGRVIFLGEAPLYEDAVQSARGGALYEACERVPFERVALLDALEDLREVDARDESGARTGRLIGQLRRDGADEWLFLAHAGDPENVDLVEGEALRIRVRGTWACTRYDTLSGKAAPLLSRAESGWTEVCCPLYDQDSLLLRLTKAPTGTPTEAAPVYMSRLGAPGRTIVRAAANVTRWLEPVPVTLSEPNALLMDQFEYQVNGGAWRPREEILRLDNALREELGLPLRMEAVAQPWVERDDATPHEVRLRFRFQSEGTVENAHLALERADLAKVALNGRRVDAGPDGWYVDKCIGLVPLPAIRPGANELEITYPYGRKVDLESMYLLGDFGVALSGVGGTLTAPVRSLAFDDITRRHLPFYGGNITYHLEFEGGGRTPVFTASCYRGAMLKLSVDGGEGAPLVFSPYRLALPALEPGKHRLDLTYYGTRINTFGQLHCVNRAPGYWWGPNSWRTVGEEWTYGYRLWAQGVLKSPEITFE